LIPVAKHFSFLEIPKLSFLQECVLSPSNSCWFLPVIERFPASHPFPSLFWTCLFGLPLSLFSAIVGKGQSALPDPTCRASSSSFLADRHFPSPGLEVGAGCFCFSGLRSSVFFLFFCSPCGPPPPFLFACSRISGRSSFLAFFCSFRRVQDSRVRWTPLFVNPWRGSSFFRVPFPAEWADTRSTSFLPFPFPFAPFFFSRPAGDGVFFGSGWQNFSFLAVYYFVVQKETCLCRPPFFPSLTWSSFFLLFPRGAGKAIVCEAFPRRGDPRSFLWPRVSFFHQLT